MNNRTSYYKSELSKKQKKHVYIGMLFLLIGFIFLISIGETINDNPYCFSSFMASFFALLGIIYIPYSLYKKK